MIFLALRTPCISLSNTELSLSRHAKTIFKRIASTASTASTASVWSKYNKPLKVGPEVEILTS